MLSLAEKMLRSKRFSWKRWYDIMDLASPKLTAYRPLGGHEDNQALRSDIPYHSDRIRGGYGQGRHS